MSYDYDADERDEEITGGGGRWGRWKREGSTALKACTQSIELLAHS